jgi:hypothetical protein
MSDKRAKWDPAELPRNLVSGLFVAGKQPLKGVPLQMGEFAD